MKRKTSHIKMRTDFAQFLDSDQDVSYIFDLQSDICVDRVERYKNIYYGIGNTPVYKIRLNNGNNLHIKSEYFNSMGNSHYSRAWIPYLFIAETLGAITPNKTKLIEITSGNSGLALSIACKKLGYDLTMIVPSILPKSRIDPLEYYGAKVLRVDGYIDACVFRMRRMIVSGNFFPCNHSEEMNDIFVKIMKRIPSEYYKRYALPDYIISGLGNGISATAFFSYMKKKKTSIKSVLYYPGNETDIIYGLYNPIINENNYKHISEARALSDEIIKAKRESITSAKKYFQHDTEIYNYGYSSLLGIDLALQLSEEVNNKTFLTIAYDKNDRYY